MKIQVFRLINNIPSNNRIKKNRSIFINNIKIPHNIFLIFDNLYIPIITFERISIAKNILKKLKRKKVNYNIRNWILMKRIRKNDIRNWNYDLRLFRYIKNNSIQKRKKNIFNKFKSFIKKKRISFKTIV